MHSYSTIYNLGHKAIADLFKHPVVVEEKVDGSQFSFSMGLDGVLRARSRGAELHLEAPEKMFAAGIEAVKARADLLTPGWTYRGEYLAKPKHNALVYDRIPTDHIVLFDVDAGDQDYLGPAQRALTALGLGLESVPVLYGGTIANPAELRELLEHVSFLGGQKVEGVVIKPAPGFAQYGPDKKILMGKFVSEAFRETHAKAWSESNPKQGDIIERIAAVYATQARWQKAVQHLREAGQLENDVRDIGKLFKEVPADIEKECREEITERLYAWAWPQIRRKIGHGLPEWYKDLLLRSQFEAS